MACLAAVFYLQHQVLDAGLYLPVHLLLCVAGPVPLAGGALGGALAELYCTAYPGETPPETAGALVQALAAVVAWLFAGRSLSAPVAAMAARWPEAYRAILAAGAVALLVPAAFDGVPWGAHLLWAGLLLWLRAQVAPPPREPVSRRERIFTRILFAASCAASLVVLESGLRLFFEREDLLQQEVQVPHATRFWTLAPNAEGRFFFNEWVPKRYRDVPFRTNSLGLRDVEHGPKAPGEYRIVMLGDSFAMGWRTPLEETMAKQLETALAALLPERPVTVVNAGVAGYGPWQSRDLLRELGFLLEPDLVIHQVFIGNDVDNTLMRIGKAPEAYDPVWRNNASLFMNQALWNVRVERWLFERSYTLWALSTFLGFPERGDIARRLDSIRFLPPGELPELPPSAARMPSLELDLKDWYPGLEEGFALMLADIAGTRDDCRARGVDYMVFLIPPGVSVIPGAWDKYLSEVDVHDWYEYGRGLRVTRAAIEGLGIPCLDLTPAFLQVDRPELLYIENDGHLTVPGAKTAADAIAAYLVSGPFAAPGRAVRAPQN